MEAFHVPEDLAAKGYTGTVVAERVLDHLKVLQADSTGNRAGSSYSMNWGENLKVEIPETGVSLGELKNFLHENLGHQTRIRGEVVHTDKGLAIHVRAGEESGERIDGTVSELDALTERAAERIYARTQPYRYAFWQITHGRPDEGVAVLRALAANPKVPATERAWAYQGLSQHLNTTAGDFEGARQAGLEAVRLDSKLFDGQVAVGSAEMAAGHFETGLKYFNQASVLIGSQPSREDVDPLVMNLAKFQLACILSLGGDAELAPKSCEATAAVTAARASPAGVNDFIATTAMRLLLVHDAAGVRVPFENAQNAWGIAIANASYAQGVEDWSTAARSLSATLQAPTARAYTPYLTSELAYVTARLGDLDAAEKIINETPTDCYQCVRTRGKIAALKKDWPTAERWFSEAAKQGPSLPFANTEWGEMLLTNGDTDRARGQFQEAVKRQPHFADPYQYWGEALLAMGDARGAITRFEQAVKYAPKWGRTQIQWGAALKKLGREAEAKQKFAAAETVELVPSERALLSAVL
jgi:tetratricopeptide (TPR) repeat protein